MILKYRAAALCAVLFFICSGILLAQQETSIIEPSEAPSTFEDGASGAALRLGPDEAVKLAVKNNLGLQRERTGNEAKKRAADAYWNVFIPTVEVGGYLGRLNEAPQTTTLPLPAMLGGPITMGGGPQWRLGASLSATLNLNFGIIETMKKTRLDYEAGLISLEKARLQLERDVRKAYYNILLAGESLTLLKSSLENAERRVAMAQANYRAGLIPEVSLLQARVAVENLRPSISETENGYKMAMASFAVYLGLPYDAQVELAGAPSEVNFISPDTADLISRASSNKPEIAELKKQILGLQSQRKTLFYNLYTPSLILSYNMDPAFGGDPWKDNWFESNRWAQSSGMFRIALGWRLNGLFPWTQEQQGLQALDDGITAANLGLAQAIQGTEVEVYNIILQLEKTRTQAEAQQATVDLAERTYRLSEQSYRAGLKEFLEVQNDELALRQARLNMLQQNYAYFTGLLDLEYAIGVPFGTLGRNSEE